MNFEALQRRVVAETQAHMRKAFAEAAWGALGPLFDKHRLRGVGNYWIQIEKAVQEAADYAATNCLRNVQNEADTAIVAIARKHVEGLTP